MPTNPANILNKVLDLLLDTVFVVDGDGEFVFASASCHKLLGYTSEELVGRKMFEFIHPEDIERTMQASAAVKNGELLEHFENRYLHKDGRAVDIMWSARWSDNDQMRFAVARDITERKHAERKQNAIYDIFEAAQQAANLETIYPQIHRILSGLLPSDLFFAVEYDSEKNTLSFPYLSGVSVEKPENQPLVPSSLLANVIHSGKTMQLINSDGTTAVAPELGGLDDFENWLGAPLLSNKGAIGALVMARANGQMGYTQKDIDLLGFVSSQVATTIQQKQAEAQLQHLASHDPLTDLPNRILFQDRFEQALKYADRQKNKVALLYLDLDGFKEVNDKYGHQAGDAFLQAVAKRLTGVVRASDTVARMGGDEFAVLITNIIEPESIIMAVEKIRKEITSPILISLQPTEASIGYGQTSQELTPSVSIGVAVYPENGQSMQDLIRYADTLMYHAKRKQ